MIECVENKNRDLCITLNLEFICLYKIFVFLALCLSSCLRIKSSYWMPHSNAYHSTHDNKGWAVNEMFSRLFTQHGGGATLVLVETLNPGVGAPS